MERLKACRTSVAVLTAYPSLGGEYHVEVVFQCVSRLCRALRRAVNGPGHVPGAAETWG